MITADNLNLAKETQKTYMALKQPPYRPPPQVFGPVWTMLYGLMGYSAYRAWNTGMSSLNPRTIELTKVSTTAMQDPARANGWDLAARRYALHHPAGPQFGLDAALLRLEATHRGYCRYCHSDRRYGLLDLHLVASGHKGRLGSCSILRLVGFRHVLECMDFLLHTLDMRAPTDFEL